MSSWTYVDGVISVAPFGNTQEKMRYILETVLDNLPVVSGSEKNMQVSIVQPDGHDTFILNCEQPSLANVFFEKFGTKIHKHELALQSEYILVLHGKLRDRYFKDTYRELQKFLCRLAKRVSVMQLTIRIWDYFNEEIITNARPYRKMFEKPSWLDEESSNWCEYLLMKEKPGHCIRKKSMIKLKDPNGKIYKVHVASDNYYSCCYIAYVKTSLISKKSWRGLTKKDAERGLIKYLRKQGWQTVNNE